MKPYTLLALLFIPVLLYHPVQAIPALPSQTDDGLDPINLIFTGFAPASWVAQNLVGWNTSPCSEPKTLDGRTYDANMETPDTRGQLPPCWGPRYHIRIWDIGTDPLLGHVSLAAVHHEHTECTRLVLCHHVIDSWEKAEAMVRSTFTSGNVTLLITSHWLNNARLFQGIPNDGNATWIQLSPTPVHSVTFQETGLPANAPWSITLNGTTSSSTSPNITVRSRESAYSYKIGNVPGFVPESLTGNFNLTTDRIILVKFTSTRAIQEAANQRSMLLLLGTSGAAWSIIGGAVVVKTILTRRKSSRQEMGAA